ncbi:F420H2-dehydrogenase [Bacteroidia bacterium]|nr:F420H2-dehydrogenase [Bacteroidia bacterium]
MEPDAEGFFHPVIDVETCIECELCYNSCPVVKSDAIFHPVSDTVFAAWSKNHNEVMQSTSGGVFPVLANQVLSIGGVVYGCAWGNEFQAEHIRITSVDDLWKLKKSKYVQSFIGKTFCQVKEDLENELTVLYSGTGCQIAGLNLFLKKKYANLITIDLVCHGVPSHKILKAYVDYLKEKGKSDISELQFRTKKENDHRAYISWKKQDEKRVNFLGGSSPYMRGFYQGFFNRESCYSCKFAQGKRVSDITLADYFGIEAAHPEFDQKKTSGVSLLICNSPKGIDIVNSASSQLEIHPSSFEKGALKNRSLSQPVLRPTLRDYIYKELDTSGFKSISKTYLSPPSLFFIYKMTPYCLIRLAKWLTGKK